MAVHDSPNGAAGPAVAELPDVVPFELSHLTRMSWALGSRTVGDDAATVIGRWEKRDGGWALAAFAVTTETAVIRLRTPVGRERFYGAIRSEVRTATRELEADDAWRAIEQRGGDAPSSARS
ncbi:hypothetical protein [Natronomonas amylolytica]|uniref:hypothetical protein n=1 Tax=Natronomonas amylolytica TaxID=3108498 RepID=UPI003009CE10